LPVTVIFVVVSVDGTREKFWVVVLPGSRLMGLTSTLA